MKKKTKKTFFSIFATIIFVLSFGFLKNTNYNDSKNKVTNFYKVTNSFTAIPEDEDFKIQEHIAEINNPPIVLENNNLILSNDNQFEIINPKNKRIFKLTTREISTFLNYDIDLKIIKIKEKNNKLFFILGSKDLYNNQLSSYFMTFNLINKEIEGIQLLNSKQAINQLHFFDNNKILLMGNKATLDDLKNNKNVFVYDFENQNLINNYFIGLNLGLSSTEMKKSFLLNLIEDKISNKKYARLLLYGKNYSIKIIELASFKLIKANNAQLINLENNINFKEDAFNDGELLINLDLIQNNYVKLKENLIAFISSSYKTFGVDIAIFNTETSQLISRFYIDKEKLKNEVKISNNQPSDESKNLISSKTRILESIFTQHDLRLLNPIKKDDTTILSTFSWAGKYSIISREILFKGRILQIKFDGNYQNMFLSALENNKNQIATWISDDFSNIKNKIKLEPNQFFYGFISKRENDYVVSNGLSNVVYSFSNNNSNIINNFNKNQIEDENNIDFNFNNINKNQLASEFLQNQNNWINNFNTSNKEQISVGSNDFLGNAYISYYVNENGKKIEKIILIKGFNTIEKHIPKFKRNLDKTLYEIVDKKSFKTLSIDDINKEIVKKYKIILLENINDNFINIEKINSDNIKISYLDPKLSKYKHLKNYQIYNDFSSLDLEEINVINNIGYYWNLENSEYKEIKKYKVKYFTKEIAEKLFCLTNEYSKEIEIEKNENRNSVLIKAKVYFVDNFYTQFEIELNDFGNLDKEEDEDEIDRNPSASDPKLSNSNQGVPKEEMPQPSNSEKNEPKKETTPIVEDKPAKPEEKQQNSTPQETTKKQEDPKPIQKNSTLSQPTQKPKPPIENNINSTPKTNTPITKPIISNKPIDSTPINKQEQKPKKEISKTIEEDEETKIKNVDDNFWQKNKKVIIISTSTILGILLITIFSVVLYLKLKKK